MKFSINSIRKLRRIKIKSSVSWRRNSCKKMSHRYQKKKRKRRRKVLKKRK